MSTTSTPLDAHFQVVDPEVQEIVGPPSAYFEIDNSAGTMVRIEYRAISLHEKTRDKVIALYLKCMEDLRSELKKRSGSPIIWWRRRPDIEPHFGSQMIQISFRLASSPTLPSAEWERIFGRSVD